MVKCEKCGEENVSDAVRCKKCGYVNKINSNVEFSVFTYDSEDDFVDNKYRGNSIYTINICNGVCK